MRKFFSVLLCIILIISICFCSSVSGSAVFVIDDALLVSVGVSLAATVLLSIGIAAVSDSDSIWVEFAEACGQSMLETMLAQYSMAEVISMITIENGKAFFRLTPSLLAYLQNWVNNFDWLNFHKSVNITSEVNSFPSVSQSFSNNLVSYSSSPYQLMTVNQYGTTIKYNPTSHLLYFHLNNDGSVIRYSNVNTLGWNNRYLQAVSPFDNSSYCYYGVPVDRNDSLQTSISNAVGFSSTYSDARRLFNPNKSVNDSNTQFSVNGVSCTFEKGTNSFKINNQVVFSNSSIGVDNYMKRCIVAGRILVNTNNSLDIDNDGVLDFPINTDYGVTEYTTPIVTERLSPAITSNSLGSDQTALVPIPATFEDPSNPGIPLPQRTVKNRVKRGQDVALVPDLPSLKDKTPHDLGVLVVNNTEIQDTTISPTLDTSVYGENSTTFVIVPQVPINTPIPNDDNQPLVSSPYPDVINPGNETISINAGDDVFPTASNPPVTTVRPSVSVSNPDEVASSAAGEVVEGVSDIVKEGVSELVEPLSPSDIEKGANRMKLTPQLLSKFPFCIPFDFYNAINQFSAPAEVPQFDIPIIIDSLNFHYNVHVDLTQYETAAKISRWFFSVTWVITLIFLTRKVIWK